MSTTVLYTEDDGTISDQEITDNYLVIFDGSAYASDAVVQAEPDGTYTHRLTIRGCKRPAETTPGEPR